LRHTEHQLHRAVAQRWDMWAGAEDRLQQRHLTHRSWTIHLLQGVGAEQLQKAISA